MGCLRGSQVGPCDHGRGYSRILVLPLNQNTLDQPSFGQSAAGQMGDQLAKQLNQLNNSWLGNHIKPTCVAVFLSLNILNESKIHKNAIHTCNEYSSMISMFLTLYIYI